MRSRCTCSRSTIGTPSRGTSSGSTATQGQATPSASPTRSASSTRRSKIATGNGVDREFAQACAGGREHVTCIVLGRGADEARVVHWLQQAAGVSGYIGFAVGRTLWWNQLREYVAGPLGRAQAVRRIAGNYQRMVDAYVRAQ